MVWSLDEGRERPSTSTYSTRIGIIYALRHLNQKFPFSDDCFTNFSTSPSPAPAPAPTPDPRIQKPAKMNYV